MMNRFLARCLPLAVGLALVTSAGPASAQRGDVGRGMEQEYGVVSDDTREGRRLNDQLDGVVQRIVGAVNQESRKGDFRLKSAKLLGGRSEKYDRVVNAFALPDGRIYVTLGLMRLIQNDPQAEDELAFVVGHEVTHVTERHSAQQTKKSTPYLVGALLLGALTKNQTIGTLGQYGAAAASSHFSRVDEYEADEGGLKAMARAGYDPDAAITMLNRLKEAGGSQSSLVNGWFGSHPLTENRVSRIKEQIAQLDSNPRYRNRARNRNGGRNDDRYYDDRDDRYYEPDGSYLYDQRRRRRDR